MPGPLAIGTGDATHGARGALPRQGAINGLHFSLQRDTDTRWALGGALEAVLGQGVIGGCAVRDNGGLSCIIPSGAKFFQGGACLSLDADAIYNGLADNASGSTPNTVWATLLRTEAAQTNQTASDTWALSVTSNTTDVAPAAYYFRLAKVATKSGAIIWIGNAVPGKFVAATDWLRAHYTTIPAGEASYLAATQALALPGPLTINGEVTVDGTLTVL